MNSKTPITTDTLFEGNISCSQHVDGYRFSVDSVLLAHFVKLKRNDSILELGTGCGIIMLILLYRWKGVVKKIAGIELQSSLATLAKENIKTNGYETLGEIIDGDIKRIRSLVGAESYQIVVSNPPFYPVDSGRLNCRTEATQARHQVLGTLDDFLVAAAAAVVNRGSVYFVYPAELIGEFISLARKRKLEVKKLQFIYSYPQEGKNATLVLIQCVKNGGVQVEVLAPFYIYKNKNGPYSRAMEKLYDFNLADTK